MDQDSVEELNFSISYSNPDALSYTITKPPKNGEIIHNGNQVSYRPYRNFVGEDSFYVKAIDGTLESGETLMKVRVREVFYPHRPQTPAIRTAYPTDSSSLHIAWLPSFDVDTSFPQIKYHVFLSENPDFTPNPANKVAEIFETKIDIPGLTPNKRYYFAIVAEDLQGNWSRDMTAHSIRMATNTVDYIAGAEVHEFDRISVLSASRVGSDIHAEITMITNDSDIEQGDYVALRWEVDEVVDGDYIQVDEVVDNGSSLSVKGTVIDLLSILKRIDFSMVSPIGNAPSVTYGKYLRDAFGYEIDADQFIEESDFQKADLVSLDQYTQSFDTVLNAMARNTDDDDKDDKNGIDFGCKNPQGGDFEISPKEFQELKLTIKCEVNLYIDVGVELEDGWFKKDSYIELGASGELNLTVDYELKPVKDLKLGPFHFFKVPSGCKTDNGARAGFKLSGPAYDCDGFTELYQKNLPIVVGWLPIWPSIDIGGFVEVEAKGGVKLSTIQTFKSGLSGKVRWQSGDKDSAGTEKYGSVTGSITPTFELVNREEGAPVLHAPETWKAEAEAKVTLNMMPRLKVELGIPSIQEYFAGVDFNLQGALELKMESHNPVMLAAYKQAWPPAGLTKFEMGLNLLVSPMAKIGILNSRGAYKFESKPIPLLHAFRLPQAKLKLEDNDKNYPRFDLVLSHSDGDIDTAKTKFAVQVLSDAELFHDEVSGDDKQTTIPGEWIEETKKAGLYARYEPVWTDAPWSMIPEALRPFFQQYKKEETGFLLEGIWKLTHSSGLMTLNGLVKSDNGCSPGNAMAMYQFTYNEETQTYTRELYAGTPVASTRWYRPAQWYAAHSEPAGDYIDYHHYGYVPVLVGDFFQRTRVFTHTCKFPVDEMEEPTCYPGPEQMHYECELPSTTLYEPQVLKGKTNRLVSSSYLRQNFLADGLFDVPDEQAQLLAQIGADRLLDRFSENMLIEDCLGYKSVVEVDPEDGNSMYVRTSVCLGMQNTLSFNGVLGLGVHGAAEYVRCSEDLDISQDTGCWLPPVITGQPAVPIQ